MHKNFFQDILHYSPELIQGMIAFNLRKKETVQNVDKDELNNLDDITLQKLWELPEVQLAYATNKHTYFWDFANETRRLALFDQETLQKLMLYMGICINAKAIARCVTQKDLMRLQEGVGQSALNFALHRGQFILGNNNTTLFNFLKNEELLEKIFLSGIFAMHFCTHTFPDVLYSIFWEAMTALAQNIEMQEHVLRAYVDGVPTSTIPEQDIQFLWFSMKKILIKEVAPQWKPYFSV